MLPPVQCWCRPGSARLRHRPATPPSVLLDLRPVLLPTLSQVGMFTEVRQLSASVTQRQLEAAVAALCADPRIDGVLVQLPLPAHIDEEAVIDGFDPLKDVDGFHPLNMGARSGFSSICGLQKAGAGGYGFGAHAGSGRRRCRSQPPRAGIRPAWFVTG